MQILNPPGWPRPKGYANGIVAEGRTVFVAGQIGWNADGVFVSDNIVDQVRQALENTIAILAEAEAGPEHIARMTWYVTDKREYVDNIPTIGTVWREVMGRNFPVMSVVQVVALIEDRARVEIESTAVVPPR
ncbi:RidA family protein [Oceanibacterium hippocampi]|uniref:Putative reactive intermediate deaminase TdcF n=1 Tax=Oceanibacterium hippocampi TaxID=745714 RepID=A0A1Y5SPC7_9PROT|nr:RidA family protein [Oceanibacterium hippocampi]SLN44727.1 Putative reactive intermediate deaminase TdcF [Oceanibacterium hippocampi]